MPTVNHAAHARLSVQPPKALSKCIVQHSQCCESRTSFLGAKPYTDETVFSDHDQQCESRASKHHPFVSLSSSHLLKQHLHRGAVGGRLNHPPLRPRICRFSAMRMKTAVAAAKRGQYSNRLSGNRLLKSRITGGRNLCCGRSTCTHFPRHITSNSPGPSACRHSARNEAERRTEHTYFLSTHIYSLYTNILSLPNI